MGKPKVTYFDITFWKGEVPRIAFFHGGVDFEDNRLEREQFATMKANGDFPFGQVPVLEVDGKWCTQGVAIIKYAGKLSGLYPADNWEAAKVDEVLILCEELMTKTGPTMRESDPEKKKAMREEVANVHLPDFFARVEKLLGDNTFLVANKLSVADLSIWKLVHWLTSGTIDHIPTTVADSFPKLKAHYNAVDTDAKVSEWKKKFPQFYK